MNLRTQILRSNVYRELGMFDESILELEEIDGDDRWHPLVVEARYNTYRDAKEWELAKTECGDPTGALQLLKDEVIKFGELTDYVYAVARQYALMGEIEDAKLFVKRAIKRDASVKKKFLDDPSFDAVWESF